MGWRAGWGYVVWVMFLMGMAVGEVQWGAQAQAQVVVAPRRPSQTRVRWGAFEWQHVDILVSPAARGEEAAAQGRRALERAELWGAGPRESWGWAAARLAGAVGAAGGASAANFRAAEPGGAGLSGEALAQAGGVRLFFYEAERPVARLAAASIEEMYGQLAVAFEFVPQQTFSLYLYSSYLDFLQTNLFPIQEGVLGVTSPQNLDVTLPYLGDHALFRDIARHELAHEFTIQKVAAFAEAHKARANPLMKMPLWFIEGLAEYYAKDGLDPQTDVLVRDLLVNPDAQSGYVFEDFFDERWHSFVWTYKLGQARCAFLQQTYGEDVLQRILEQAYRMVGDEDGGAPLGDFATYLAWIVGEPPQSISQRFESWVKQRHYKSYLRAQQAADKLDVLGVDDAIVQALSVAPGGEVLMYRKISAETGQCGLSLVDYRAPGDALTVIADGSPGVESLHPIAGRNFDVGEASLAFVAQQQERDVIYWQRYERRVVWGRDARDGSTSLAVPDVPLRVAGQLRKPAADARSDARPDDAGAPQERRETSGGGVRAARRVKGVEFLLGARAQYRLADWGIVAVNSLALGPDGRRIAFVGLSDSGQTDLYMLLPDARRDRFSLRRLTHDIYAERDISWGPSGIVFTSDATESGHYNLFLLDPENGEIKRLTAGERDEFSPRIFADGRIFFVAYDEAGANIYEVTSEGVYRRTAFPSALSDLGPAPDDGVWALQYYRGRQRALRIPQSRFLAGDVVTQAIQAVDVGAYPIASAPLDDAQPYEVWRWDHWELGNIFAIAGAGAGGVAGQFLASATDQMQDHALVLNVFAQGDLRSIDGSLFYLDQSRRTVWGGGIFQDVGYRVDNTFAEDPQMPKFISSQRFFGGMGTARYPFDRFTFVQGGMALGGMAYFLSDGVRDCLGRERCVGRAGVLPRWEAANDGVRFQAEPSVSLGYNTLSYHPQTGPFMGHSALVSATFDWQPFDGERFSSLRLDAEKYWSIWGRTNFFVRAGTGYSFGSRIARAFFLSSFDTLRGVPLGDLNYLLGRSFFFGTAELQFPLNFLVRVPFLDLEGIVGADFGAAADSYTRAWQRRVLDAAVGVNFGLGPFVLRLHFAKPFEIGAIGLPNRGAWNTNFSLAYRY